MPFIFYEYPQAGASLDRRKKVKLYVLHRKKNGKFLIITRTVAHLEERLRRDSLKMNRKFRYRYVYL